MSHHPYVEEDYYYSVVSDRLYACGRRVHTQKFGSGGYRGYLFCGKVYAAHRLIWYLVTGAWPEHDIDHINRNRSDNRWLNFREADDKTQPQNRGANKNNKLRIKGIRKNHGKYEARITKEYKTISLGLFDTLEEAIDARKKAEQEYFTHAF